MNFEEFKDKAMATAIKNDKCYNLLYASNALAGEVGEFANMVKKYYRDGVFDEVAAKKEIFDNLWYDAYICDIMGWTFDEIIDIGFEKLRIRNESAK